MPGQEENGANLWKEVFLIFYENNGMLRVLIRLVLVR